MNVVAAKALSDPFISLRQLSEWTGKASALSAMK